jgi:hypothetical protein
MVNGPLAPGRRSAGRPIAKLPAILSRSFLVLQLLRSPHSKSGRTNPILIVQRSPIHTGPLQLGSRVRLANLRFEDWVEPPSVVRCLSGRLPGFSITTAIGGIQNRQLRWLTYLDCSSIRRRRCAGIRTGRLHGVGLSCQPQRLPINNSSPCSRPRWRSHRDGTAATASPRPGRLDPVRDLPAICSVRPPAFSNEIW